MEQIIGSPTAVSPQDLIKESSTATFQADVLDASRDVPIIVDFWATWCGPCKQLTPLLEKVVTAARGAVRLVKIDVDKNQELAAQLRIQSVPTVFAFKDGRPVDGFAGALPESQLKAFVQRLTGDQGPSPIDEAMDQAQALMDSGDHAAAGNVFMQVLQQDPGNTKAAGALIRCAIAGGQLDQARQILDQIPTEEATNPEIEAARTALELAEAGQSAGDTGALQARIAANEDDHEARYDLAQALYGAGDAEAAIDHLLELFKRNRAWNDEAARMQLLKIFEALGPTHPATAAGRRKLSSMLFS